MGETGPTVEEAEAEFETEAAVAGLLELEVDPPAVPGLSLNSERSRSICFRLYSSGIQTSLLVRGLLLFCDPARLDLFEAFAYAGRGSAVGDEGEGLVALGLAEEAFGLAFIFTFCGAEAWIRSIDRTFSQKFRDQNDDLLDTP